MNYGNNNFNGFNGFNANNNERNTKMNYANDNSLDTMNPAPRCPVILLLDISGSMSGAPINELNEGFKQFLRETTQDEAASSSVELEVITFESNVEVAVPFSPISSVDQYMSPFCAGGGTSMGAALKLADQHLRERRRLYRSNGISSYRPWVVLMTDGGPNDYNWEEPAAQMRALGEQGKIQYIGIEIGDFVDHNIMCQIMPAQPGPVKLQGLRFKQFFRWLTDSLKSVSSSALSEQDKVPLGSIKSWADLSGI